MFLPVVWIYCWSDSIVALLRWQRRIITELGIVKIEVDNCGVRRTYHVIMTLSYHIYVSFHAKQIQLSRSHSMFCSTYHQVGIHRLPGEAKSEQRPAERLALRGSGNSSPLAMEGNCADNTAFVSHPTATQDLVMRGKYFGRKKGVIRTQHANQYTHTRKCHRSLHAT